MLGAILLIAALVFAGQVVGAIRNGTAHVPLKILEVEEFDRNENPANFWGVTGFNAMIAMALAGYGTALVMEQF